MMDRKTCIKCGIEKPLSDFYTRKGAKDGYRNDCKQCVNVRGHERYLSRQEEIKAKVKSYYLANQEKKIDYAHDYYKTNKEKIAARQVAYNAANKEVIAERKAAKYQADTAKRAAYRIAHPKMYWAERTVGHHRLTGKKIREDVLAMAEQTTHCPICQCELKYSGAGTAWHSASLDRKLNDQSKSIDNIWIVCRRCNTTKLDRSMEEMDEWCLQWQKARQGGRLADEDEKCDKCGSIRTVRTGDGRTCLVCGHSVKEKW